MGLFYKIFCKELNKTNPSKIGWKIIKILKNFEKTPFGPSPENGRGWNLKNKSHTITHTSDHYLKKLFGSIRHSKRKVVETYVSIDRRPRRRRRHCHNIIRPQFFCGRIKSCLFKNNNNIYSSFTVHLSGIDHTQTACLQMLYYM